MPRFRNKLTKKRIGQGGRPKSSEQNTRPSTSSNTTSTSSTPSSSTKKLSYSNYEKYSFNDSGDVNELININILSEILVSVSLCRNCKTNGLQVRNTNVHVGVASQLEIYCSFCNFTEKFYNSRKIEATESNLFYDVNVRLVYGLRCIGKGQKAGQVLCGILNLPQPPSKFKSYIDVLCKSTGIVAQRSMTKAVEEAVIENKNIMENENPRDLSAAFDGTWQKRGFKSLNGVVTCTSVDSGKVLDIHVLSKYCICDDKDNHLIDCQSNYQGPSGGMEVVGVKEIFKRSLEKYNVRYINYLGDGDTKSYLSVIEEKPYGDVKIKKLECLGHVQKRMGARLRKVKLEMKGKKLSDGLPVGGRNRLTDQVIDQLQTYYGLAIRKNTSDLQAMKRAVWAIYFHKRSTDEKPIHGLCPTGSDSWCRYNKTAAIGGTYKHKTSIPEAIMDLIKPVFRDLSSPDLLKKCLHGKTQNANESVNNVIWTRVPKNTFVSKSTLEFGVLEAVASFNNGYIIKCDVLYSLGIQPGERMLEAMKNFDKERIRGAENSISEFEREARRQKRSRKRKLEEEFEPLPAYDPGMY